MYCAYACVQKDCYGFAFFCGDLSCSCKYHHRSHIQDPESWRTVEELQKAIDGPPAIEKTAILEEWRAMDRLIRGLAEQVERLRTDHDAARKAFLDKNIKYAEMIPLIKAGDFSVPQKFTADRLRRCLDEHQTTPMFPPAYGFQK